VIVADASLICDFLLNADANPDLVAFLSVQEQIAAPAHLEFEVGNVVRKHYLSGKVTSERGLEALQSFLNLRLELHGAISIADAAWRYRDNLSFYDASYVALAETLSVPLYTRDKRLRGAPGLKAEIILL
jgi:predicted nucleic acid-binding protein